MDFDAWFEAFEKAAEKFEREEAQRQTDLFIPQPDAPKPVQQSLLGDAA